MVLLTIRSSLAACRCLSLRCRGAGVMQVRSMGTDDKDYYDKTKYYLGNTYANTYDREVPFALGKHRSNALELVNAQPIIMVEGERAICDGGGGALGHPIEYISLQRPGDVKSCIYCGLKYKSSGPGKAGHH